MSSQQEARELKSKSGIQSSFLDTPNTSEDVQANGTSLQFFEERSQPPPPPVLPTIPFSDLSL